MDIPPLSSSFLSVGFINPEMIQGNEEEVMVEMAEMADIWESEYRHG